MLPAVESGEGAAEDRNVLMHSAYAAQWALEAGLFLSWQHYDTATQIGDNDGYTTRD